MKIGADRLSSEVTVQLTCAFVFSICENQDFSLRGSGIERGYIFIGYMTGCCIGHVERESVLKSSIYEQKRRRSVYTFVQSDGSFCC